MLLILLLISWSHFLDLTAKFMSFSGFQIQTDQAKYLPNNSSFFSFSYSPQQKIYSSWVLHRSSVY